MKIKVLDHGYVELVEAWGHGKEGFTVHDEQPDYEAGIVEAARQSTQGNFRGWAAAPCTCDTPVEVGYERHTSDCASVRHPGDERLLKYLLDHKHHTPFEFAGMVLEVQAPIFVFREWHRHRTQSYNEMSARYTPLPPLYYVPTVERLLMKGGANKQAGSVTDGLTEAVAQEFISILSSDYRDVEDSYQSALGAGVPKELARLIMPVGHYSRMRVATNLRCWLQFLTLRLDPAAQWEIRQYAEAVREVLAAHFPVTLRNWK